MQKIGAAPGPTVMVALLAIMPAGLMTVSPSVAVAQSSTGLLTVVAQAQEQKSFNIEPQSLQGALIQFGQQSGRQIAVEGAAIRGLTTPGVQGTMSVEQALGQLLSGSGLTFSFPSSTTIALHRPGQGAAPGAIQLDPVQVQAYPVPPQAMIDNLPPPYAGGQVATGGQLGLLGNRPIMDTPFNQTSYTSKKAQDQQAKTIRDVLIDDPSVRFHFPEGSPGVDAMRIRGFATANGANIAYGGLYGMLPWNSIMAEMAERIEVLKGPSAMLNGMTPQGIIGGTINVVPKRAPDEPLTQATANYASSSQFGGHIDVGRRFGPENQFGVRANGVFRAGATAVGGNSDKRGLAVLGLDFRGERVRLSADLGFQSQYIGGVISYIGIANAVPLPYAPNARTNQGQPWGYLDRQDIFGVVRGEVDLTENVTAYAAVGAHDNRNLGLFSSTVTISNFQGAATALAPINYSQYQSYFMADAGLRARATTGPIAHELALTASTYWNEAGSVSVNGAGFATNIYNPTVTARPYIPTPQANKTSTQNLQSIAIADTLSAADKRVQLTVGARLQQVTSANFNAVSGTQTTSYGASALTPSVALVVKPFWENVTFYANYIQGLQQGTTVPIQFSNAGEVFPPYKSTQYEAGIKIDWGKLTTTASVFQISQPSILTNVATNSQFLGGEQVNQGLELNFFGELSEGVRALGGAMFLNAVLAKTAGGATNGWIAPFSPGAQFNLGGEWDLPFAKGLTLSSRVTYTSAQYIDTTFPRRTMPEWVRFDVGARYAFENPGAKGKLLVARFNVENVLDANYWAGGFDATTMNLGAPRVFRLALTADF